MDENTRQKNLVQELRHEIDGPLLWLGVLVGVVSGISATARLLDIGLGGVFQDFIGFYRELLSPIYRWIRLIPWPFDIPEVAVDFAAVYIVLLGMGVRSESLSPAIHNVDDREEFVVASTTSTKEEAAAIMGGRLRHTVLRVWLRSIFLLPILQLSPLRNYLASRRIAGQLSDHSTKVALRRLRLGFLAFVSVPLAVMIFFLMNAYVPQMTH